MKSQKDLFDDTTMTFGEHLEALRIHLWWAIIGLAVGVTAAFFFSNHIIVAVQRPVVRAMEEKFGQPAAREAQQPIAETTFWESAVAWYERTFGKAAAAAAQQQPEPDRTLEIQLDARDIIRQLHAAAPAAYPALPDDAQPAFVTINLAETPLGKLIEKMRLESLLPRTDRPDEAFMIYLKVSLAAGFVLSSPWIFYQLWLFVAAGLYPHERKYVYTYLPISVILFLGGTLFCFFVVIPYVLGFLFDFNIWLGLRPEIKIGDWISFALVVSLMFGVSFQLPLVMLLLEKIGLVSVQVYREKRRYAILIISILSMVLTPSDPVSMIMMLVPLCLLYELGILLCARTAQPKSPFEAQPA
ncbi:MAG: twin-arginine translocase subunit TatC [Planctomycetaceae bacterium]